MREKVSASAIGILKDDANTLQREKERRKGREEREGWWDPRHTSVSPSLKRIRFHERKDSETDVRYMLTNFTL